MLKTDSATSTKFETLWSIKELSEKLSVKAGTIYAWTNSRQIPIIKLGRLVRFDPKEIRTWLEEKKIETYKKDKRLRELVAGL